MENSDKLVLGGREFSSRFILGSGKYSMKLIESAVKDAGAEIITLAVRRANTKEEENILDYIPKGVTLLPNTSGARTAEEAVRIARLARELGCGDFVKIEIMRDTKYLLPDNQATIKATEIKRAPMKAPTIGFDGRTLYLYGQFGGLTLELADNGAAVYSTVVEPNANEVALPDMPGTYELRLCDGRFVYSCELEIGCF